MTSPPAPLRSHFLERLDDSTRGRVYALARDVATELDGWLTRHPAIPKTRVRSLALTFAATAPVCSARSLASTARVSLWIFAVDDAFDEGSFDADTLFRSATEHAAIARGVQLPASTDHPLAIALHDIIADLSTYPLFGPLRGHWADALGGTLESMKVEHRWRDAQRESGSIPSYEEYIDNGRYSVGGPPHFVTWMITIGESSVRDHFGALYELALRASTCIRLSNDLQTFEREAEEGNINSTTILRALDSALSLPNAKKRVQSEIEAGIEACRALARDVDPRCNYTRTSFIRLVDFVCEFYRSHDYHHAILSPASVDSQPAGDPRQRIPRPRELHSTQPSLACTAYDTAWVASLRAPSNPNAPRYPSALQWLVEHQHPDGSWGGSLRYEHDRIISTLAALRPLCRFRSDSAIPSERIIDDAVRYLWQHAHLLSSEPIELVGFEMLVPTLMSELQGYGLELPPYLDIYRDARQQKLALIPKDLLYSPEVTIIHSIEFLGVDADFDRLAASQYSNGSIGNSPAATAYLLDQFPDDANAISYVDSHLALASDTASVLHPCHTFDILWSAYHLFLGGVPALHVLSPLQYENLGDELRHTGGISLDSSFPIPDADDTAVALILMHECGVNDVPWDTLDRFRTGAGHYASFPYERHASSGVNIHVLDALRRAPPTRERRADIRKIVEFLASARTHDTYWLDKWHISPYYVTSHITSVLCDMDSSIVDEGLVSPLVTRALDWIRRTQNRDGSWGFFCGTPTSEETAYCLLALCNAGAMGHEHDTAAIERGSEFLARTQEEGPSRPPMWIDKCLYLPMHIVGNLIEAARGRSRDFLEVPPAAAPDHEP